MLKVYKCWDELPDPLAPSKDLQGEIPSRALKFCEPFLVANSAGFLACSPVDVVLTWSGCEILAEIAGIDDVILVDKLFLPDYIDHWRTLAPEGAVDVVPPFIEAFPERGMIQVWSGLFVSTPPGISCWVRGPVNRAGSTAYSVVEGVVETDWWIGPLFFVIQIHKTDFPVKLSRDVPFMQVIPVVHDRLKVDLTEVRPDLVENAPADFWDGMVSNAVRRNGESPGSYRREARRLARS